MEKTKIAFLIPNLEIGGAEKSLVMLLRALVRYDLQIELLLFDRRGSLISAVPPSIKIIELNQHNTGRMLETLRRCASGKLQSLGLHKLFHVLKKGYHRFGTSLTGAPLSSKQFDTDVVIAYKDGLTTWYVANHIPANKKIAFIHTDLMKAGYNLAVEEKVYQRFDRIFCVSTACRDSFLQFLPQFIKKTAVLHTRFEPQYLMELSQAGETFTDSYSGKRILTICRLSPEKGLTKAISALARLKKDGFSCRWYVIGAGKERRHLLKQILKQNVSGDFILLGEKENPYAFLRDCDYYVQPSDYESYCLALAEARALRKPIVACDFMGAKEQIQNEKNGLIVGLSPDDIYSGIKRYLSDPILADNVAEGLNEKNDNYQEELSQFVRSLSYISPE